MRTDAPSQMPSADEIFGRRMAPPPWSRSRPVLALAVELLPTVADDLTADLLEEMALTMAHRDEELRAVRMVLSQALERLHRQYVETRRLQRRLAVRLDAERSERGAA